ncbi:hypothetical protein DIPPA_02940 [Diplonema papillatum]|nr:hypothetical protein DIPPA_02940 [Diplonema papillatum]
MPTMVVPRGRRAEFTKQIRGLAKRLNRLAGCKYNLPNTNGQADTVMGSALRDFLASYKRYPESVAASQIVATVDGENYRHGTTGKRTTFKLVHLFHHREAWPDGGVDEDCVDALVLAVDGLVCRLEECSDDDAAEDDTESGD